MKIRMYRASGFTLFEVLLVIVILVMLAALVLPNLVGRQKTAQIGTTKIQMKSIQNALEFFKTEVGRYPTTEEGLTVLNDVEQLEDEDLAKKWNGPYLQKVKELVDAWGHEFRYVCPGENNEKGYDLSSDGPDGEEGTEDDIVNWEKEEEEY